MISKVIHYCWFGHGKKPEQTIKCIESWKRVMPDYKLKEWNEDNFNIESNLYVKQAYESKKFAFVTDYVRLYALYTEGGVYMDTDVETLKPYDPFLRHHAVSGFETDGNVPTGMMAAEKGSIWAKELLEGYANRSFIKEDGSFDMTTNTVVITEYMLSKGLLLNNQYQDIPNLCTMYPAEYFCPKDHRTGKIKCTKKTVCIHHFAGSWLEHSFWGNLRHNSKLFFVKFFGERIVSYLANIVTGRIFKK